MFDHPYRQYYRGEELLAIGMASIYLEEHYPLSKSKVVIESTDLDSYYVIPDGYSEKIQFGYWDMRPCNLKRAKEFTTIGEVKTGVMVVLIESNRIVRVKELDGSVVITDAGEKLHIDTIVEILDSSDGYISESRIRGCKHNFFEGVIDEFVEPESPRVIGSENKGIQNAAGVNPTSGAGKPQQVPQQGVPQQGVPQQGVPQQGVKPQTAPVTPSPGVSRTQPTMTTPPLTQQPAQLNQQQIDQLVKDLADKLAR